MTLVIVVGTGMLGETGCTKDCCSTVIRPAEVAAMACICSYTHAVAAPIPRAGSGWLDEVCRVPNWTSRVMVASILAESISPSRWRRPTSGSDLGNAAALAGVAALSSGTATAVTAEADKNVRRVAPVRPGGLFLSMPRINACSVGLSTLSDVFGDSRNISHD